MNNVPSSGIDPGQRRLNGPQTTGREYRNMSQSTHTMAQDDDVAVPMRDGVMLLADVHRPAEPGRYPVLVAASPYPRQIQNLGAPAGFIEAGASDFFVPRGYVHGGLLSRKGWRLVATLPIRFNNFTMLIQRPHRASRCSLRVLPQPIFLGVSPSPVQS